ncbi:MAG TPA: hypothetical protein VI893_10655 [Thermoplasmata archaeon]|nr:hypothetical protein [Thermoplasmata archaeon]
MPKCDKCEKRIFKLGAFIGSYVICKKCRNHYHHGCATSFAFIHQWQRWVSACPACARDLFAGSPGRKIKSHL